MRPNARKRSARSSPNGADAAEARAITTTSTPTRPDASRRTTSRKRRFTRLRTTAFPTLRLTVNPNRHDAVGDEVAVDDEVFNRRAAALSETDDARQTTST